MSAELLREAAALMRSRAVAANACGMVSDCTDPAHAWYPLDELRSRFSDARRGSAAAEHIASWHPAVALAVADWLDTAGADLFAHGPLCCDDGCMECDDVLWMPHVRRAIAVARAYLGGGR